MLEQTEDSVEDTEVSHLMVSVSS